MKNLTEFLNESLGKNSERTLKETPKDVADILLGAGYKPRSDGTWEHPDGRIAWPEKKHPWKGEWITITKMPGVYMPVKELK